jgi:hypothetical protein
VKDSEEKPPEHIFFLPKLSGSISQKNKKLSGSKKLLHDPCLFGIVFATQHQPPGIHQVYET